MKALSDSLDDLGSTVQSDLNELSKQSCTMKKTLLERIDKILSSQEMAQTLTNPSMVSGGEATSTSQKSTKSANKLNNKTVHIDLPQGETADATLVQETLEATNTRFEKLINGLGTTLMPQGANLAGAGLKARPPKFGAVLRI